MKYSMLQFAQLSAYRFYFHLKNHLKYAVSVINLVLCISYFESRLHDSFVILIVGNIETKHNLSLR